MATYMLMGEESTLKPHVGHKIEVTGTLGAGGRRGGAADTGGATTTAGTPPAGTTAAGETAGQGRGMGGGRGRALRVESVKMLSPTCP